MTSLSLPEGLAVGDRIRMARLAIGMRPTEMARALGMSLKTYQRLERGEREPRLSEIHLLVEITGQTVGYFYGTTSPAEPVSATISDPDAAVNKEDNE
jgi:transcriptional regulator with XRE-family HTH domain